MAPAFSDNPALSGWPFWVLELTPSASLNEVNRAAREIAGKLALQMDGAGEYPTPAGVMSRDEFLVREAQAVLIDPQRRLLAEFWYLPPAAPAEEDDEHRETATADQWRRHLGVG
ncbi:hypothetical protein [Microbulbifer litoralis]|uniref:hypothetical protein n=1 Tax=Microbulbifer litoralis TaxID=2933965 RepID=UPI002028008B|nr:hypothetical protein [Microbulbifer sp. GX H0434]